MSDLKTNNVCTQAEIHFITPAYSCTKQLCMVNWSAFQSASWQPSKFTTGRIIPMKDSNMEVRVGRYYDIIVDCDIKVS